MLNQLLSQIQEVCVSAAAIAVTALVVFAFSWLRSLLGIVESDSNEMEIRRAAETEAGVLTKQGNITNPDMVAAAAAKIIADLPEAIRAEKYTVSDVTSMILGAASMIFK